MSRRPRCRRPAAAAFTLVELMVSIVLVLLLILGVNQVFKLTSDTIGATNGLSDAIRTSRAVQQSLLEDLRHAVMPGEGMSRGAPFLLIRSERVSAFADAAEEAADRDYTRALSTADAADDAIRSADVDGDNAESLAEAPERTALGRRSHRVDQISFFARDLYRRQTGNDPAAGAAGTYAADMTASEAWVWYGHLSQPDATADPNGAAFMGTARNPGWTPLPGAAAPETAATNPNNFYARRWLLGRVVHLLQPPELSTGRVYRYDPDGTQREPQAHYGVNPADLDPVAGRPLQPLGRTSQSTVDGATFADPQTQWSRFDLIGTSIADYEATLRNAATTAPANGVAATWWAGPRGLGYRFGGFPYPTKPMTPAGAARTVPCFATACTQFAVEFAGDFITQLRDVDADGDVDDADQRSTDYGRATHPLPDGVLDFVAVHGGTTPEIRVRWYGFPRNVDTSDDLTTRAVIKGRTSPVGNVNAMRDVVPVRDVLAACPPFTAGLSFIPALFERDANADLPNQPDYGAPGAVPAGGRYVCAWGPHKSYVVPDPRNPSGPRIQPDDPPLPKMLRIVVGLDDENGRMTATQFYEYVIEVP